MENLHTACRKLHSEEIEEEVIWRNNDKEEISDIHQIDFYRCISSYADYEIENLPFAEWTKNDRNEQSHQILNDEEIIRKVTGHNTPTDELKEEEEDGNEVEEAEFSTNNSNEQTSTDMDALDA